MDNNCSVNTTGKSLRCLNLGSYNYLGFADNWLQYCGDAVLSELESSPVSMCSAPCELGKAEVITQLEEAIAKFLGQESAFVCSMGYGTNSTTIPAIMGEGSLIISDSLNHTSLVNGSRGSCAKIRVFKHNTPSHLEQVLRESIVNGQPRIHRPWKKILVMVEGIYSMEGAICDLAEIVRICKKYKAYLYVDEAHSIGALGRTGRGVTEYCEVNPADVDVLMGTFSKSFGGMGGRKIAQLHDNCNYFRREMERIGMHLYGDYDSPIIPVLIYLPGKVAAFSRMCLARGVAVVVVGFPATSLVLSRARFCISAAHTREDIDRAVKIIDEVANEVGIKYCRNVFGIERA
ncbi:LCB2a [Symbiodinium microadriaticum]|nr:LCB2a [Symbiodinium microadriaticum]